jgi:hypothetical protein
VKRKEGKGSPNKKTKKIKMGNTTHTHNKAKNTHNNNTTRTKKER